MATVARISERIRISHISISMYGNIGKPVEFSGSGKPRICIEHHSIKLEAVSPFNHVKFAPNAIIP
ncbi:hypothetical protein, partial [Streptococcus suis]|uniref:hypothetical protein n=1 Tax=Streptococcus suis TaxID=1307 RepID=UPI00370418CE